MTVVEAHVVHEWRLVAPWWHWPLRSGPTPAVPTRHAAPVLQKYDGPDLVNTFLADPQRRLAFIPDTDEVATVTTGGFGSLPTRTSSGVRKVYLGSHHRHYLVTAALHCDVTGFPHVARTSVCEAGFVVRRRTSAVPSGQAGAARGTLRQLAVARRKRGAAEAQLAAARAAGPLASLRLTALEGRLRSLEAAEADASEELRTWAAAVGVARTLQGWVAHGVDDDGAVVPVPPCAAGPGSPAPLAGTGGWRPVDELPEHVDEATFPLYPLVADPRNLGHDAAGETVWFGVVPTGGAEVDLDGHARFDDRRVYEIRCFVRRHRAECPPDSHCKCPVTWSEPTEPYQVASHFDLEGTANRPVTVQLPDLAQLQADALRLSPGGTGGVRFQSPPNSSLPFSTDNTDGSELPANGDFQICSFSIPLITIVAMFVFKLFLPIVIFVFQLWWMLALRFCIPPDVSVGGDLSIALDALGPGLEIDASIAARLDIGGDLEAGVDATMAELLGGYKDKDGNTMAAKVKASRSGGDLDVKAFAALVRGVVAPASSGPAGPVRVFAPRVERDEVVAP